MGNQEKNQMLLTQLIFMFQTAALQQMGKLKNPTTDKIERELPQAQISIDMLDMLHAKMGSNLTPEEDRLFSVVLQELKLNYVDEVAKNPTAQSQPASPPPPSESTPKS